MAPEFTLSATVLGAPDAQALADFYHRLLGWEVVTSEPGWAMVRGPKGRPARRGARFAARGNRIRPRVRAQPRRCSGRMLTRASTCKAAALLESLLRNHSLVDGNKRTG